MLLKSLKRSAYSLTKGAALMGFVGMSLSVQAPTVFAQEGEDANAASRFVDNIVVTARKKEESVQDVPISITAVSGVQLEAFGVSNFEAVDIPGVSISRGGMADAPSVRGIGSGTNLGFEQSAPLYIDGVYFGRGRLMRFGLTDLESVEVLKGPQPVYYGKNAIAGAIGLRTRKPTDEFEYGLNIYNEFEHDELTVDGFVSGPISETVRGRLAFKTREMDGFMYNATSGKTEPNVEDFVGRGQLEFDVSDTLTITTSLYGGSNEDNGRNNQIYKCTPAYFTEFGDAATENCVFDLVKTGYGDNPGAPGTGRVGFGESNSFYNKLDFIGGHVNAEWELSENISVTSLTAYYEFENDLAADPDNGEANVLTANFTEEFSQFSQEIRVNATYDNFEWLAGFYIDSNENDAKQMVARNFAGANAGGMFIGMAGMSSGFSRENSEEADSWGIFGEVTFEVSENVSVSAGGRYTEIEKSNKLQECTTGTFNTTCTGAYVTPSGGDAEGRYTVDDNAFQPSVTVEYRPVEGWMTFVSYREGFKAGGFDFGAKPNGKSYATNIVFEPEDAQTIEIGAKGFLFDNRVSVSGTVFQTTVENLQVTALDPDPNVLLMQTTNAGELEAQGFELESTAYVTESLSLSTSISYLNSEYSNFVGAQCYTLQPATECVGGVQDLTGAKTPYAPEFSGTVSFNYERPLSDKLNLFSNGQVFFTDGFLTESDNDPNAYQGSYNKVDLSIGVADANGTWSLALVGRNITDELTAGRIFDSPGAAGTYAALTERPRTLGIQLRLRN